MTGGNAKGHLLHCNMPHVTLQKAAFRDAKDGLLQYVELQGVTPQAAYTIINDAGGGAEAALQTYLNYITTIPKIPL